MSGTAELAQDFFPVSTQVARYWLPWLWDRVFPAYGALLCPKPFVTIQVSDHSLTIGWPILLVVAFLGVIIGWGLGMALSRRPRFRGQFSWASSFFFFGVMNAGAIGYHCFSGRLHAFYVLDVVGTACSSLSIVVGCLATKGVIDDRSPKTKRWLTRIHWITLGMVSGAKLVGVSIVCEMFYVLPMQFAGIAVLWLVCSKECQTLEASKYELSYSNGNVSSKESSLNGDEKAMQPVQGETTTKQSGLRHRTKQLRGTDGTVIESGKVKVGAHNKVWLFMTLVSILVGSASVSLDRMICKYEKANWLAVVWIFAACDLAFSFMYGFVQSDKVGY